MSGASPSRRLRTKTSDLTDFFRGNSSSTQPNTSSSKLEVPSGDEATSVKKKITRIPLFGRSRKKSNQSSSSSPFVSSNLARESSDLGEQSSTRRGASTDARRPSVPSINAPVPPLPTQTKVPTSSLTSKLAAHFSHSRSSKQYATPQPPAAPSAVVSSGLEPPATRSASFESGSSTRTKRRSITPRPAQPVITVSLSPDEQFQHLFTRPRPKNLNLAESSISPDKSKRLSDLTPSATPPGSPLTQSPEQSIYRRGYTPASAIAAAARHRQNSSVGSDRAPSTSSRKNSDSDKSNEASTLRESPRFPLLEADNNKGLPPSFQRRPSAAVSQGSNYYSENGSATVRSRMKRPSSATPAKTRPPSMPLPLPPTPTLPPAPVPIFPPLRDPELIKKESTSSKTVLRPRAHTIGSVVDPSIPLAPLARPTANNNNTPSKPDGELLDIDKASIGELRQALRLRNLQYDELASFILKMTESHVAEVTALEKKISTLTKDALKREKQIKGFTILLSDEESSHYPKPLPPGVINQSRFASSNSNSSHNSPGGGVDSDPDNRSTPPSRKYSYQSDSGAESHATSGAESLRASGASGSESMSSMFRNKKLRRPYPLSDQAYAASRMGSVLRSSRLPPGVVGSDKGHPDTPYTNSGKRSSVSSMSGSPSSSTSSLLPPSPSITVSSLSAIPESPTAAANPTFRTPRYDSSSSDHQNLSLKEERRALRTLHCTSTSSLTSSSTAASSSYSTTIKRSRPPSIAQVLEKSPTLEDVLEKLRPFS